MPPPDRFQRLLSDLSPRFSGVGSEQIDAEIERALDLLIAFLGTERATLLEILPDDGEIAITCSRAVAGVAPAPFRKRAAPWYRERLARGETMRFERLPEGVPEDEVIARADVAELSMRSHLAIPILIGERWVCALVTGTTTHFRAWPDEVVEQVEVVGQILANALYRTRLERELRESVDALRAMQLRLEAENQYLRESIGGEMGFEEIVGKSPALRDALEQVAQVAPTGAAVLLLGETGTGKELLARAIHARSDRREGPLIKVNCAALPASLVESELFGHEKGAFTGATSARPGRFELADGGTLFLDEIGDMAPEIQVKLLRVLQDGEFERVGGVRTRKADVRLVAATNRDLELAIAKGRFREDLYYRISVFPIRLPPLRDRREDIPFLVWELIQRRQDQLGRRIKRVPDSVMQALARYAWPGNVRELGNVIERAMILSPGPVLQLDPGFAGPKPRKLPDERIEDVERTHILRVLERCHWRIGGDGNAAAVLGMRPSTLRSRLAKLGIRRPAQP